MELKHGNFITMDDDGVIVMPKTKASHPYSYDPIVLFSEDQTFDGHPRSCWSDHLFRQHPDTMSALKEKHFGSTGDYWPEQAPEKVKAFLSELLNVPELHLVRITEHCNVSSGYPVWHFMFEDLSDDR